MAETVPLDKLIRQSTGKGEVTPVASAKTEARAASHAARQARTELRRAARERRRFERGEVRRFTRRSRNRRVTIGVVLGLVAVLVAVLAVAVYSPILALRTIEITGAKQLDTEELLSAVDDQVGTPLALVDFDRITRQLGSFPLIRSYVTETIPPSTLVIHVVEREAVGMVKDGSNWAIVDPAGVVLSTASKKDSDLPEIKVSGGKTDSDAFAEAAAVLLALPDDLRKKVVSISASTEDDVTFTMTGSASQKVVWGNADNSEFKARVLAILVKKNRKVEGLTYNVASPDTAYVNS